MKCKYWKVECFVEKVCMIKYLDILFYFEWIIEMLYKWLKIDKKNDIRRKKKNDI